MAPRPFFAFPAEVRIEIYEEMFLTKAPDLVVTPDITRSRRNNGQGQQTLNLQTLTFLRTCTKANREGTLVLYGKHVFRFDDTKHGHEVVKLPGFGGKLSMCDMMIIEPFLLGTNNVEKINHLHLVFQESTFFQFPSTSNFHKEFPGGGRFVEQGLRTYPMYHGLKSVRPTIQEHSKGSLTAFNLFFAYRNSPVTRAIRSLGTLQKFVVEKTVNGKVQLVYNDLTQPPASNPPQSNIFDPWKGFLRLESSLCNKKRTFNGDYLSSGWYDSTSDSEEDEDDVTTSSGSTKPKQGLIKKDVQELGNDKSQPAFEKPSKDRESEDDKLQAAFEKWCKVKDLADNNHQAVYERKSSLIFFALGILCLVMWIILCMVAIIYTRQATECDRVRHDRQPCAVPDDVCQGICGGVSRRMYG